MNNTYGGLAIIRKLLLGTLLTVATTWAALAQGPYAGGKVMWIEPGDDAGFNFDSATNAGIVLGYELVPDYGLGMEAEFTTTVSDGEFSYRGVNGDWDTDTQAIYLVARPGTEVADLKVKLGYMSADISASALGVSADDEGEDYSWGLGGGYNFTQNISAEVEWTEVGEDVSGWSGGVNYKF